MDTISPAKPTAKRPRRMAREPKASGVQPSNGTDASALTSNGTIEPRPSKTALVLNLLACPEGASLAQLIEATGWLPHTTRAALTGLRKKGYAIAKCKVDDVSCYRLDAGGAV